MRSPSDPTRDDRPVVTALILVALGAGLPWGGCASAPPVAAPAVDVAIPARWSADAPIAGAVDLYWWRSFRDEGLDRVIRQALVHNRDLRAVASRVVEARSQARIVGADALPQVSAGASGRRERLNFIGFPIPGGSGGVLSTTSTRLGLSVDVSWELDLWGRIRARESAALADVQAAEADLDAAVLSLTAQAAKAWFGLAAANRQVALAEATVASYQRTRDQTADRAQLGLAARVDERLAQANLASAQARLAERRAIVEREVRRFEILLGAYPNASARSPGDLPAVPDPVPAGLPADLVRRRPDLASAERRVAAASRRIDEARAALYPRISLTGGGGTASEELGDLLDGDFRVWSIAGNLLQPIFEGGRLRARVEASRAAERTALEEYADALLTAFAEVETALALESILAEWERRLVDAVAASREGERLASDRYNEGVDGLLAVLEAQRRALESESQLIIVRRLRLDNRIDLHLALGGGFDIAAVVADESAPESQPAADRKGD